MPGPPWIPKSLDAQVPFIKWCSTVGPPYPCVPNVWIQPKFRQNLICRWSNPWMLNPQMWSVNCILFYFLKGPPITTRAVGSDFRELKFKSQYEVWQSTLKYSHITSCLFYTHLFPLVCPSAHSTSCIFFPFNVLLYFFFPFLHFLWVLSVSSYILGCEFHDTRDKKKKKKKSRFSKKNKTKTKPQILVMQTPFFCIYYLSSN